MTQESATPPGFWERVEQVAERVVARAMRSGANRNMSLSGGGRFTIKGGALVVESPEGGALAYFGGVYPAMPDGTSQAGLILRREDGSLAAALYDPTPDPGSPDGFKQFFAIYDRAGKIVLSDDTSSGQGLARPYVPIPVTRARFADMVAVTDGGFVDVFNSGWFYKVNARARADIRCTTDEAATTGEVRVLVDDVQVGVTATVGFEVGIKYVGPFVVPGDAYSQHVIKVQARRTAGTGAVRLDAALWGTQS